MTSPQPSAGAGAATEGGPGLAAAVGLYAFARLGLVALVTAVLFLVGVPFIIALLVALIVALPLSMVLFRGLRGRLETALAQTRERRTRERDALRARLRGDVAEPARPSDEPAQREPDTGQG